MELDFSYLLCYNEKKEDCTMRIQKCYIGYCIVMWVLWIITSIFIQLVGTSWDFYSIAVSFSYIAIWVVLIPVHWILGIWALVSSIKHQRGTHTTFNVVSMCVNGFGGILMLVLYMGLVG